MNQNSFKIGNREINSKSPTYFIADIAANHDGSLEKAKKLIYLAKESGADAVKFQHFKAKTIVSDFGFKNLGTKASHQKEWKKSIYQVYKDAEVPLNWTEELYKVSQDIGIDFFTSPYDINDIAYINKYVPAYKVGSGDITYHQIIDKMSQYDKPILIATGASNISEVTLIMDRVKKINQNIVLMQCNTNYTAEQKNLKYIQLDVLKTYGLMFPEAILGLSDHTLGDTTVLGAVALGAKVIEKHFTDNNDLIGPDHNFSMNPTTWKKMVERTRDLELALGTAIKKVENNELETSVLQRRCLRVSRDMDSGDIISKEDIEILRPAPINSIPPYEFDSIIGKQLSRNTQKGDFFRKEYILND